jgi:hypothetical protein
MKTLITQHLSLGLMTAAGALMAGPVFYNTGVDNNHTLLSGGSPDPHYQMRQVVAGAYVGSTNWSPAIAMDTSITWGEWIKPSDARWIYLADAANLGQNWGTYEYMTAFNLSGYDPYTAVLAGRWAVDQDGSIYLNGNLLTSLSDGNWNNNLTAFNLISGFVPGTNTLTFYVRHPDGGDGIIVSEASLTVSPLPSLSVTSSGQQVTVAWPATATNYVLLSTLNLSVGPWVTNSAVTTLNGTNYFYVNSPTGRLFFRLKR